MGGIAGGKGVFAVCNGSKAFGEDVAALAEGGAVGHHFEEHVAVGVETVCLYEVETTFRCLKPFASLLDVVVGKCSDEAESSLEPHALGAVHQLSVAVEAGIDAAVHAVQSVFHPEGQDVVCQLAAALFHAGRQIFTGIHCRSIFFFTYFCYGFYR